MPADAGDVIVQFAPGCERLVAKAAIAGEARVVPECRHRRRRIGGLGPGLLGRGERRHGGEYRHRKKRFHTCPR
jgi:hypothetical protein